MQLVFFCFKKKRKYHRDLTNEEIGKCQNVTVVMEDEDWFSRVFENLEIFKGETKWIKIKSNLENAEEKIKLNDHNGSIFDSWNILKVLPTWCRTFDATKTARALNTAKVFNIFCDVKKTITENHQTDFLKYFAV